MVDLARALLEQQVRNLNPDTRLIIAHPNWSAPHVLLHMLLEESRTAYVRFDDTRLDSHRLANVVMELIQDQVAEGISATRFVILDECDRLEAETLEGLITVLLGEADDLRVVVFSRTFPHVIRKNDHLRSLAQLLPVDPRLMLHDYLHMESPNTLLEVHALGSGQVLVDGRPILIWDGELPRNLFFYLVDRGMTTRNQIFEAFWPDLSVKEATNVFHVTKRKISEILGVDLTSYWSGYYRISPDIDLSYDVALFSELAQESAVASDPRAVQLLREAGWLYNGRFLATLSHIRWVAERQTELSQVYAEALVSLGKLLEQSGRGYEALFCYTRALSTNRHREDLAGSIMRLYESMGLYDDALTIYTAVKQEIETLLGISPAGWLQELARDIKQKVAVTVEQQQ
ncbi:MAG: bacterial transcriptional activator domain-containing protein [Anaerolineae bacterium]|nr:bacterial transcriptional activator domain-containing protein [Anaerolineae bacterium]